MPEHPTANLSVSTEMPTGGGDFISGQVRKTFGQSLLCLRIKGCSCFHSSKKKQVYKNIKRIKEKTSLLSRSGNTWTSAVFIIILGSCRCVVDLNSNILLKCSHTWGTRTLWQSTSSYHLKGDNCVVIINYSIIFYSIL